MEYPVLYPARSILYKVFVLISECSDGLRALNVVTNLPLVFNYSSCMRMRMSPCKSPKGGLLEAYSPYFKYCSKLVPLLFVLDYNI